MPPIFPRVGGRMRAPEGPAVRSIRRVNFGNVVVYDMVYDMVYGAGPRLVGGWLPGCI